MCIGLLHSGFCVNEGVREHACAVDVEVAEVEDVEFAHERFGVCWRGDVV